MIEVKKYRAHILCGIVVFLIVSVTVVFWFLKQNTINSSARDEAMVCLRDADCRSRLEAAVNQVYSEIGYDDIYAAP